MKFHSAHDTVRKIKIQATDREKIFVYHISDKKLYQNKELSKVNSKKNTIKNWAKDLNTHFTKDIGMVSKHRKRCSTSVVIRKMQIEPTMKHHYITTRMATGYI